MANSNKRFRIIVSLVLIILAILFIFWIIQDVTITTPSIGNIYTIDNNDTSTLLFTMIDVGQGDSFLLQCGGKTALVDCGPPSAGKTILSYLKEQEITKIDYLFGTHPHDDHMGGMEEVITGIEIGTVIIPEVTLNVANWYMDLMEVLVNGNYDVQLVSVGNQYLLGDAVIEVIGPLSEPTENLNNYSIVLKVSLGEMDILMTGDAEKDVEKELLDANVNLEAELLKVGHHGSSTSTSAKFLKAVNPSYAFVSCKVGNRYKHPTKEVLNRLLEANIPVFRTDECGTVVAMITKNEITFNITPGDYLSGPELEEKLND